MVTALIVSTFLFTVLVLNLLIGWVSQKEMRLTGRLKDILAEPVETPGRLNLKAPTEKLSGWLKATSLLGQVAGKRMLEKIQINLIKAGVPLKAEEIVGITVLTGAATLGIGLLVFPNVIMGTAFGLMGFAVPILWVSILKQRRLRKVDDQLLDATVLLASSLRAGHSFLQALELVSKETPDPLSEELSKVIRENKLGTTIEESLIKLTKRLESKELELIVTGVLIQREVGGNLAEILDSIAKTIEKRIKMKAKIRALTAQGRLSGWIVSLLPFALATMVFGMYPEFGQIMLEEQLGLIMLAVGLVMMFLGILVIRKVVNIDV